MEGSVILDSLPLKFLFFIPFYSLAKGWMIMKYLLLSQLHYTEDIMVFVRAQF